MESDLPGAGAGQAGSIAEQMRSYQYKQPTSDGERESASRSGGMREGKREFRGGEPIPEFKAAKCPILDMKARRESGIALACRAGRLVCILKDGRESQ